MKTEDRNVEMAAPEAVASRDSDTPIAKVGLRSQLVIILASTAAFFAVAAFVGPFVAFWMAQPRMMVAVVDATGNVIITPLADFWSSDVVFQRGVSNVCSALFNRNPNGPDEPLLLKMCFTDQGRDKAKKLLADSARLFKDNQIYQSFKLGVVKHAQTKDQGGHKVDKMIFECQLIQNGTMNDVPFTEPIHLKVTLQLVRNDDMAHNGMFPLLCHDFDLERLP